MILISCVFLVFGILNVASQSPCDDSNAHCRFRYHNSHCMYYNGAYVEIADQSFPSIQTECVSYWNTLYSGDLSSCSSSDKLIWPIGECGCPLCNCPSSSFCCYDSVASFDINDWNNNVFQIQCNEEQDMCLYSIDANDATSVTCSDTSSLNSILSINVTSPSSTILAANNNSACYTFVESENSTKVSCFCGESGCNQLSNIIAPDLLPKNGCYVSDSFHNENYWSNYVYEDNSCEMCTAAIIESPDGNRVDFACKSRASCYSLLYENGGYNDDLSGCVVTSDTGSSTTECCCDPSIDGNLCNQHFLTSNGETSSRSNFGCWKADFITVSHSNWDSTAKRINCSSEYYGYCVIQSFGSNRYSSNCETQSNCDNLSNNKRVCCNDTDFCNDPDVFESSSAINNFCLTIICILSVFSFALIAMF